MGLRVGTYDAAGSSDDNTYQLYLYNELKSTCMYPDAP